MIKTNGHIQIVYIILNYLLTAKTLGIQQKKIDYQFNDRHMFIKHTHIQIPSQAHAEKHMHLYKCIDGWVDTYAHIQFKNATHTRTRTHIYTLVANR